MPRPRKSVPSYLHHKARDLAYVRLPDGTGGRRVVYLGKWDSPESRAEYQRVLKQLEAATQPQPTVTTTTPLAPVVNEVMVAFVRWANSHYLDRAGKPTTEVKEIRSSLGPVRRLYGHLPATEFGPVALEAVRDEMVRAGWCRTLINRRIERVKRMFRWAARRQMLGVTVYEALRTVPGLRKGRTAARESEPVGPVDPEQVAATLPKLNRHVRAMVLLQRYTGMRPAEVCGLTLGELDRAGHIWVYEPSEHKTAHRGKTRVVPIGPRGRAVLTEFLAGVSLGSDDPVFSPARERAERFTAMRAARKSKVQPSQLSRKKANPKRVPAAEYHPHAYANAIAKAAAKAGVGRWHPNQLRHLFATEIRREHGLEAVQVVLGHSHAKVSEIYGERDLNLALRVAGAMG